MFQISTMNLSMEVLQKWRSSRASGNNNKGSVKNVAADDVDKTSKSAENNEMDESTVATPLDSADFPAKNEECDYSHASTANSTCSPGKGQLETATTNSALVQPKLPKQVRKEENLLSEVAAGGTRKLFSPQSDKTKNSTLYKTLAEMSHLGLKLSRNDERIVSMIKPLLAVAPVESAPEPDANGGKSDNNPMMDILEETRQLHQELMTMLGVLHGDRTLSNMEYKIQCLEQRRRVDIKQSKSLIEKVAQLEREQAAHKRGLRSSYSADCSAMDTDGDMECEVLSPKMPIRNLPILTEETIDFIDNFRAEMHNLELTYQHLTNWSKKRESIVLSSSRLSDFFNKRMKEECCQELIPILKEVLEDTKLPDWPEKFGMLSKETTSLIDNCKMTMNEMGLTNMDLIRWALKNRVNLGAWHVSCFMNKKMSDEKAQQIIPVVREFFECIQKPGYTPVSSHLSAEMIDTVDQCKRTMDNLGLRNADVVKWSLVQNEPLSASLVSDFFRKRLSEQRCAVAIPLIKQFLEEQTSPNQCPSTSVASVDEESPNSSSRVHRQNSLPNPPSQRMSRATKALVDRCRQAMSDHGLVYNDLSQWLESSDFKIQLSKQQISKLMTKAMSETQCQEVIPALKEFVEQIEDQCPKEINRRGLSEEAVEALEEAFQCLDSSSSLPDDDTINTLAEKFNEPAYRVRKWFHNRKYSKRKRV